MSSTRTALQQSRLDEELELRAAGFVPVTSYDAPFSRYDELLPQCSVVEVLPKHDRQLWSHVGPSGLDPRAVAPLALVRVADGWGEGPLDEPIDLAAACRWLLTEDVSAWLQRSLHRVVAGHGSEACLVESMSCDAKCLRHQTWDDQLERVARSLGGVGGELCVVPNWSATPRRGWRGVPPPLLWWSIPQVSRQALVVLRTLASWAALGTTGTTAWELSRRGITVDQLVEWQHAGFTVEEAALWCARGDAATCRKLRDKGIPPIFEVTPAPYGAYDSWTSYARFGQLGIAYAAGDPGPAVPCGDRKCPTSVSLSVTSNEGVRL